MHAKLHAGDPPKSTNLYQPLPAPADRMGRVVVVEGTLDAMAIAVAAIRTGRADRFCPLTQSGRELSSRQLDYVLHVSSGPPIISFDGDAAGRESAARLVRAAGERAGRVLVTSLPDDQDPASWLDEQGPAGLELWTFFASDNEGGPGVARSRRDTQAPGLTDASTLDWAPGVARSRRDTQAPLSARRPEPDIHGPI